MLINVYETKCRDIFGDNKRVSVQIVETYATYHCEKEELLDCMIEEFEKSLIKLRNQKNEISRND